jgi:hypothetical protein
VPLTKKLSAEEAVEANEAVPNKEPVNDVAITDPVILNVLPL